MTKIINVIGAMNINQKQLTLIQEGIGGALSARRLKMRPIKFRAWCDPCHSFVPAMQLFHGDEGLMMYCPMHEGGVIKTKLTEWTGLLDKNGVEIYEGDIIVQDCYPWFDNKAINYRGTVEWIYSQWQIILHCVNPDKRGISDGINEGINDEGFGENQCTPWEVIGNIYENPELLND